jgi:hypothetical protein
MTESELPPPQFPGPRVSLAVSWQGRLFGVEKPLLIGVRHYAVDRAVWEATVKVRRELAQHEYPDAEFERRVPIRNEFEAFSAIRTHCLQTGDRFELIPPGPAFCRWRAYFKKTSEELRGRLDNGPSVGIGSVDYIAIENLLRFTEGRDPIND